MQELFKVKYLPCKKGGDHQEEDLNLVCLEPACRDNLLCCLICAQQFHTEHKKKPLKHILMEAKKEVKAVPPTKYNNDIALEEITSYCRQSIEAFTMSKNEVINKMEWIQNSLNSYYDSLIEQVKLKSFDHKMSLQEVLSIFHSASCDPKNYIKLINRLLELAKPTKQQTEISEQEDIMGSFHTTTQFLKKALSYLRQNMEKVTRKIDNCWKSVQCLRKGESFLKVSKYKFQADLKHSTINILSDVVVQSTSFNQFCLALMHPSIQHGPFIKDFAFKINESAKNWIGVGICHKKIIANKTYNWWVSGIGHGAYMISFNAFTWSHTRANQNNVDKGLPFQKGDIISMRVNLIDKTVTFKKKNQACILNFDTIEGDELVPCVAFHYKNCEVEFLPNHSFQS